MTPLPFTVGVEIEFNSAYFSLATATYRGKPFPYDPLHSWKLKTDSSCGYEAVSPVLSTVEDLGQIEQMVTYLKGNGACINNGCGLHVHIGIPNGSWDIISVNKINRMLSFFARYENAFFALAARQRSSNTFCRSLYRDGHYVVERLKAKRGLKSWSESENDRYMWLNGCYQKHGTIEFRLQESTLDYATIFGWINLILHTCDNLLNGSIEANFQVAKTKTTDKALIVHDMLQRSNAYGGKATNIERAVIARKWVSKRFKQIHHYSHRTAIKKGTTQRAIARPSLQNS